MRSNGLCEFHAEFKAYHPDVPRSDPQGYMGTYIDLCKHPAKYIVVDNLGRERHVCGVHAKPFGDKKMKIDKNTEQLLQPDSGQKPVAG